MRYFLFFSLLLVCSALRAQQEDVASATGGMDVERVYSQGEKAYRTGRYTEAIAFFDKVLDQDAEHINAYLQRGFCRNLVQDHAGAIADFTEVVTRKPDHAWAYISRGSAYSRMGKHELAIADFERVLALDPKDQEAYNNRGWSRKALGDMKGACADWHTSRKLGNGEARIILSNNRCKK